MELKKEIEEVGYDTLVQREIDKLTKVFHEMLEFKKLKYDISWSFPTLLDYVACYYNYYRSFFLDAYTSVLYHSIRDLYGEELEDISDTDTISHLREFYLALTDPSDSYQKHAYDYLDITLQEGETYHDLVVQKRCEFCDLFRQMLDFLNIPYSNRDDYESLKCKVGEAYPWYFNLLFYGLSHSDLRDNYIDVLTSMHQIYQRLQKYREEYQEQKDSYREEDWAFEDDFDSNC